MKQRCCCCCKHLQKNTLMCAVIKNKTPPPSSPVPLPPPPGVRCHGRSLRWDTQKTFACARVFRRHASVRVFFLPPSPRVDFIPNSHLAFRLFFFSSLYCQTLLFVTREYSRSIKPPNRCRISPPPTRAEESACRAPRAEGAVVR